MKTIIQSPDFTASKTLLEFVQKNTEKLESISERVLECKVCLKVDRSDDKENKICEVSLFVPGDNFFASRQSHNFEDAVIKTIDALRHQLIRWKESKLHKSDNSLSVC
jgi:ribosomal subunit interface protein